MVAMSRSSLRFASALALSAVCAFGLAGCGAGLITGVASSSGGGGAAGARAPELSLLAPTLPLVPEDGRTASILVSGVDLASDPGVQVDLRAGGVTMRQPLTAVDVQNGATTVTFALDTSALLAQIDPTASDVVGEFVVSRSSGEVAAPVGVLLVRQPKLALVTPGGAAELRLSPLGMYVTMTVDGLLATDPSEVEVLVSTRDPLASTPGERVVRFATGVSFAPSVNGLPTVQALLPGNGFPDQVEIQVRDQVAGVSTVASDALYGPRIEFALPAQGPITGGSLVTLIGAAMVPYDFSTTPAQLDFAGVSLCFMKGGRMTQLEPQDFRVAESSSDRLVFIMPPSPDGRPGRVTIKLGVDGLRPGGAPFSANFNADQEFLFANPDPFFGPRGAVLDRTPVAVAPIQLDNAPATDAAPDFAVLTEQGGVGFVQLLLALQNGMFQPFATPRQVGDHQASEQLNPKDLLVGDFNHDGVPDLFVVNEGVVAAEHLVLLGQSRPDPPLGAVLTVPGVGGSTSGRVADFDGDGALDVLLMPGPKAAVGTKPRVLFSTGSTAPPLFAPPVELQVRGFDYEAYEVADLNGDTLMDVALCSGSALELDVAFGAPGRSFTSGVQSNLVIPGYTPSLDSPAVGLHSCRNGERPSLGLVLAGIATQSATSPTIAVLPQVSNGSGWEFLSPNAQEIYLAPVEPIGRSLAADLDVSAGGGSGQVELVIAIRDEPTSVALGLLQFNGVRFVPLLGSIVGGTAGLAEAPVQISQLAFDVAFPAAGAGQPQKDAVFLVHEVEVDGVRERRLSTRLVDVSQPNEPILLPPDGGASLAFPIEGLVAGTYSIGPVGALSDVEDLALASRQIPGIQEGVQLVLNDGFGGIPRLGKALAAPGLLPCSLTGISAGNSSQQASNEFDRLVFCNEDSSIGFWLPDDTGPQVQSPDYLSVQLRTAIGAPFSGQLLDDDTRVEVGDVDGDGLPDLVVLLSFELPASGPGESRLALLRGKASPSSAEFPFHEPVAFAPLIGTATSFTLGDFVPEPEGAPTRLELAVAVPTGSGSNAVDGNHVRFLRYMPGANPEEDRFVASFVDPGAAVLLTGSQPSHVVAGDFDRDGRVDLLVACRGDDTLRLFRNTAVPGGPAYEVDVAAFVEGLSSPYVLDPGTPTSLQLSDVNGDGNADAVVVVEQLLAPGERQTSIATYLSSGDGAFDPARFVSRKRAGAFNATLQVALGDYNRDDIPDLLLGWDVTVPAVNLRVLFGGTR